MLQLIIETTEGQIVPSSIPLTLSKYNKIASRLENDPRIRAVYMSPMEEDIDVLLDSLDQLILDRSR